jgi:hypothetical protein
VRLLDNQDIRYGRAAAASGRSSLCGYAKIVEPEVMSQVFRRDPTLRYEELVWVRETEFDKKLRSGARESQPVHADLLPAVDVDDVPLRPPSYKPRDDRGVSSCEYGVAELILCYFVSSPMKLGQLRRVPSSCRIARIARARRREQILRTRCGHSSNLSPATASRLW